MFWHDVRRPSTYMMVVIIVALAIKNYFLWSQVDLKSLVQHPSTKAPGWLLAGPRPESWRDGRFQPA